MAALRALMNQRTTQDVQRDMERRLKEMAALADREKKDKSGVRPDLLDWNRLGSKLEDSLRQGRDTMPPRQYQRAIEKYFKTIAEGLPTGEDAADEPSP